MNLGPGRGGPPVRRFSHHGVGLVPGALVDDRRVFVGVRDPLVHRLAEVDAVGESTSSTAPFVHGLPPMQSVQTRSFVTLSAAFSSWAMVSAELVLARERSSYHEQKVSTRQRLPERASRVI
jgi:hypothetical protein